MTMPAPVLAALAAAGLGGWRALSRPVEEATGHVVVLTSPDYDPAASPPRGRLFAVRGDAEWAALPAVIAKAVAGAAH